MKNINISVFSTNRSTIIPLKDIYTFCCSLRIKCHFAGLSENADGGFSKIWSLPIANYLKRPTQAGFYREGESPRPITLKLLMIMKVVEVHK